MQFAYYASDNKVTFQVYLKKADYNPANRDVTVDIMINPNHMVSNREMRRINLWLEFSGITVADHDDGSIITCEASEDKYDALNEAFKSHLAGAPSGPDAYGSAIPPDMVKFIYAFMKL
jgi:hypothetical protein